MSGSGVFYTAGQVTAMETAIGQARTALAAGNAAGVIAALNTYYGVQINNPTTGTVMRGYAGLAQSVVSNVGTGIVANREVTAAVGQATATPLYNANLALQLAVADRNVIVANGGQVPTLADVADYHASVFAVIGIPVTAWGGTAYTALGQDYTLGLATIQERSLISTTQFSALSAADVSSALWNLLSAGEGAAVSLSLSPAQAAEGAFSIMGLDLLAHGRFGLSYSPIFFQMTQNTDGSYQVADAQIGVYQNITNSENINYTVTTVPAAGTSNQTNITVTDAANNTETYQIAGTPIVQTTVGGVLSAGTQAAAILIGVGASTLQAGSGNDLLIEFGNGGTLIGGTGSVTMLLDGSNNQALGTSASSPLTVDVVGANNFVTFRNSGTLVETGTGSSATVTETAINASLNITGSNIYVTAAAGDTITETGISDAVTFLGGGTFNAGSDATSVILNGNGVTAWMSAGGGTITATGSFDTITGVANANITLAGNNDVAGTWAGGKITVTGQNETLYGSSIAVTLQSINASAAVNGNQNIVTANFSSDIVTETGIGNIATFLNGGTFNEGSANSSVILNGNGITAWMNAGGGTLTATGDFDTVTGGGIGTVIDLKGNNDVAGTWAGAKIAVDGQNATVYSSGVAVTLQSANASATVNGNQNIVTANFSSDTITETGIGDIATFLNGGTFNEGSAGSSVILNGNGVTAWMNAGGGTLTATGDFDTITGGGTGTVIDLKGNYDAAGTWAGAKIAVDGQNETVYSSGVTVTLQSANASATVNGNQDDVILSGGFNKVSVFGGFDTIDIVASNALVTLLGGSGYTVNGDVASDTVNLIANTSATVNGAGGAIGFLGSGDTVFTSNETINGIANDLNETVIGTGDTVNEAANNGFNIAGGFDTINMTGPSDYVGLLGGGGYVVNGDVAGDVTNLIANTSATVNGAGGAIGFLGSGDTVFTSNETINGIANDLNETVIGTGDTVNEAANNGFNIAGGFDTINMTGPSDYVGLLGGGGYIVNGDVAGDVTNLIANTSATVNGAGGAIGFLGSGDTVFTSNETINTIANDLNETVIGSHDIVNEAANNSFNVAGGFDIINLSAANDYIGLLGGSGYMVNGSNDTVSALTGTSFTVTGNNDTINASGDQITVIGNSDTTYGSHNTIAGHGNNDLTYGNNDTVTTTGSGDYAYRSANIGPNGGSVQGGYVFNLTEVFNVIGSFLSSLFGLAANAPSYVNIVAQTETANGALAAASIAQSSWAQTQQAIAAAASPATVAAPSAFETAMWNGPVVTWSFASGSGSEYAAFSGSVQSQYQEAIEQALQTWANATGLTFQEVPDSPSAGIRIGWAAFNTSSTGVVGLTTFATQNGIIAPGAVVQLEDPSQNALFNGTGGALTYAGTNTTLYQTALHEIGHALGLGESSDLNSIMFPKLGASNTTIDATDVSNSAALYSTAAASLAQAMASFGATAPAVSTSIAPPPPGGGTNDRACPSLTPSRLRCFTRRLSRAHAIHGGTGNPFSRRNVGLNSFD